MTTPTRISNYRPFISSSQSRLTNELTTFVTAGRSGLSFFSRRVGSGKHSFPHALSLGTAVLTTQTRQSPQPLFPPTAPLSLPFKEQGRWSIVAVCGTGVSIASKFPNSPFHLIASPPIMFHHYELPSPSSLSRNCSDILIPSTGGRNSIPAENARIDDSYFHVSPISISSPCRRDKRFGIVMMNSGLDDVRRTAQAFVCDLPRTAILSSGTPSPFSFYSYSSHSVVVDINGSTMPVTFTAVPMDASGNPFPIAPEDPVLMNQIEAHLNSRMTMDVDDYDGECWPTGVFPSTALSSAWIVPSNSSPWPPVPPQTPILRRAVRAGLGRAKLWLSRMKNFRRKRSKIPAKKSILQAFRRLTFPSSRLRLGTRIERGSTYIQLPAHHSLVDVVMLWPGLKTNLVAEPASSPIGLSTSPMSRKSVAPLSSILPPHYFSQKIIRPLPAPPRVLL